MPGREAQVVFVQQQQPEIENRNVREMLTRVGGGTGGWPAGIIRAIGII